MCIIKTFSEFFKIYYKSLFIIFSLYELLRIQKIYVILKQICSAFEKDFSGFVSRVSFTATKCSISILLLSQFAD